MFESLVSLADCIDFRYYLRGDREGQVDTFVDGLPGSPDNIRLAITKLQSVSNLKGHF